MKKKVAFRIKLFFTLFLIFLFFGLAVNLLPDKFNPIPKNVRTKVSDAATVLIAIALGGALIALSPIFVGASAVIAIVGAIFIIGGIYTGYKRLLKKNISTGQPSGAMNFRNNRNHPDFDVNVEAETFASLSNQMNNGGNG